jgi:hypothetical protein
VANSGVKREDLHDKGEVIKCSINEKLVCYFIGVPGQSVTSVFARVGGVLTPECCQN